MSALEVHMMSALEGRGEGGTQKADDRTDTLLECESDKGEWGSKNPKICRRMYMPP